MDYRLDLYNALDNYTANMNDADVLLIICNNLNEGDLVAGVRGSADILSAIVSDDKGYVNFETAEQQENMILIRQTILNIAINILKVNIKYREKFRAMLENL